MIRPDDLITAGRLGRAALEQLREDAWALPARDLEFTCRQTVNHMVNSLLMFATRVAVLESHHTGSVRSNDEAAPGTHLAYLVESSAAVLAHVVSLMPPGALAFHPSGLADGEGFLAMGTLEVLIHTYDVTSTVDHPFDPPDGLCAKVVERLFPWVDIDAAGRDALLWAAGRIALPDRPRQNDDWWVHAAPLSRWDGAVKTRSSHVG